MSLQYVQVQPETLKDSYSENDQVEFVCTFEGRKMLLNNIRLVGDIEVTSDGTTRVTDSDNIFMDNMVGIHSCIEQVDTTLVGKGNVENLKHYGRCYSMLMKARNTCDDMLNGSELCELKTPELKLTRNILAGINDEDVDFSFKPYFALNSAVTEDGSQPAISYKDSREVRITFTLARNTTVLFGSDVAAATDYKLKNLRLHYMTIPDDGKSVPVSLMTKKESVNTTVASRFANISSKVPISCNACSMSFIERDHENTLLHNNLALERLPGLDEVQFLFNDNQMNFITYKLEDEVEIVQRYLESFKAMEHSLTPARISGDRAYGAGISFDDIGYINLATQKFNIQLQSEVDSGKPYTVHVVFHGIFQL